jgi:hypothetical protein
MLDPVECLLDPAPEADFRKHVVVHRILQIGYLLQETTRIADGRTRLETALRESGLPGQHRPSPNTRFDPQRIFT